MPKATKIVVHFDDGTTYEVAADKFGSLFMSEAKAKKCGHNPPYGKPPKNGSSTDSATLGLMSTSESTEPADSTETQVMEGACYMVGGVIICP